MKKVGFASVTNLVSWHSWPQVDVGSKYSLTWINHQSIWWPELYWGENHHWKIGYVEEGCNLIGLLLKLCLERPIFLLTFLVSSSKDPEANDYHQDRNKHRGLQPLYIRELFYWIVWIDLTVECVKVEPVTDSSESVIAEANTIFGASSSDLIVGKVGVVGAIWGHNITFSIAAILVAPQSSFSLYEGLQHDSLGCCLCDNAFLSVWYVVIQSRPQEDTTLLGSGMGQGAIS